MHAAAKSALVALGLALAAPALAAGPDAPDVTVYRDPNCGCCAGWAEHMRQNGFDVTVKPVDDLPAMNRMAGIADDLQSCHLAQVGGYTVSGHVPAHVVQRLLAERPAIPGITLPGMPMGSPGMGGAKAAPFTIYEIGRGEPQVYVTD